MNLMNDTLAVFKKVQDNTAIIDQNGQSISFKELDKRLHQVCNILKKRGIKKGDRVLLLIPLSIDLYLLIGAIFKMGAIVVFIDPWAKKDYIKGALSKVSPNHVIYNFKAQLLFYLIPRIGKVDNKHSLEDILKKSQNAATDSGACEEMEGSDSALITFTSGSSSAPKGFNRTHEFLLAQKYAHGKFFTHEKDDTDLCMFPVFVLSNLAHGITSVLVNADLRKLAKSDPCIVVSQIIDQKVSSLTCSPSLCLLIVNYLIENNIKLEGIKYLYTGGAPVHPHLFLMMKKVIPNARKFLVYGSTEAEPIALMESEALLKSTSENTLKGKGTVLGKPVSDISLKIVEPASEALKSFKELSQGEVGEIIVTGNFVGKEYYKSPDAFAKNKILVGNEIWHRTGDHGYFDEHGVLFMLGRDHNIVFENDKKWYPLQIEPMLDSITNVEKSAIFQYRYNELGLLIKLKNGISQYDMESEIEENLKMIGISPVVIHFVKDIPVDPRHNSKIDINEIKSIFSEENINCLKSSNLLTRFKMYTDERFPFLATAVFVLLFSFNSFYLFDALNLNTKVVFSIPMLLGYLTMFLVFFHLRLMDEFKDYKDDVRAYPERILSRGIIQLKDFKLILSYFFVFEIAMNLYLGQRHFYAWLIVFVYSLLMYKEFFVGEWLEKRLTLYLISHQLILPMMAFYMFSIVSQGDFFATSNIWATIFIASLSFYYEIARKTWSKDREQAGADSYTSVWGIKLSISVIFGALVINTLCSVYLLKELGSSMFSYLPLAIVQVLCLFSQIKFLKDSNNKNSKMLEKIATILLLGGHLFMITMVWSAA